MSESCRLAVLPSWRETLAVALEAAERGVAGFYAIQPREWAGRFRYDIGSSTDHPSLAFGPGTLAQIVRMEIVASPRPPRWRIVLRDAEILRLGEEFGVATVLAYTLAHELVHLVRFASELAPFDPHDGHDRGAEEARVCRIARDVLVPILGEDSRRALDVLSGSGR